MTVRSNNEPVVECPVPGCDKEPLKRGLFMHIFQSDDPEGEGHRPRYKLPPDIDPEELKVTGDREVEMDYPDEVDLDDTHYLDTYTGKAYEGKRGLMIHLGQMAGKDNIPKDITERHSGDDFPIVKIDNDGNITDVLRDAADDVPPIEPYLPWYDDDDIGYLRKKEVEEFVESIRESTGAASADTIENELLEPNP